MDQENVNRALDNASPELTSFLKDAGEYLIPGIQFGPLLTAHEVLTGRGRRQQRPVSAG